MSDLPLPAHIALEADVAERLRRYVDVLLDENTRLNLTATRDAASAWTLHVLDSLAVLPRARELRAARLLDLGTGGGSPGLALACCLPDARCTLMDATRKKVEAVARIAAALGLSNVETLWARAERACGDDPRLAGSFDLVVARAVGSLSELVELAATYPRRPGGECWFYKSLAAESDELPAAAPIARKLGLALCACRRYGLPPPHGERLLVGYRAE